MVTPTRVVAEEVLSVDGVKIHVGDRTGYLRSQWPSHETTMPAPRGGRARRCEN
jgi:hypothetical protein